MKKGAPTKAALKRNDLQPLWAVVQDLREQLSSANAAILVIAGNQRALALRLGLAEDSTAQLIKLGLLTTKGQSKLIQLICGLCDLETSRGVMDGLLITPELIEGLEAMRNGQKKLQSFETELRRIESELSGNQSGRKPPGAPRNRKRRGASSERC